MTPFQTQMTAALRRVYARRGRVASWSRPGSRLVNWSGTLLPGQPDFAVSTPGDGDAFPVEATEQSWLALVADVRGHPLWPPQRGDRLTVGDSEFEVNTPDSAQLSWRSDSEGVQVRVFVVDVTSEE
jgi:hypothetical protein